jgi:hypothetical protein
VNILLNCKDCLHSNKDLSGEVMSMTCWPVNLSTTLRLRTRAGVGACSVISSAKRSKDLRQALI